jgi:hypothetical protein
MASQNKTVEFAVKAKGFVSWDDPVETNVKHCRFYVQIKDLPVGLPIDPVNTRPQNIKQKTYQKVTSSANNEPETFHHNNNGMFVVVRKFAKSGDNKVVLSFGSKDGVGDGAHSYLSCLEANKKAGGGCLGYISFNVVSKLDENTLKQSCLNRNSTMANKSHTRHNYEGKFDLIKDSVKGESWADDIAYRENELKKKINIKQVLGMVEMFINVGKAENLEPPIKCYQSKGVVMNKFVRTMTAGIGPANPYTKIKPIIPDIMYLSDFISQELSKHHTEKTAGGDSPAGSSFMKKSRKSRSSNGYTLKFMKQNNQFFCSEAAMFPILGACRGLVTVGANGNLKWKKPLAAIKKMIAKKSKILYEATCRQNAANGGHVHLVGRSGEFWQTMYAVINSK